jgi:hypothetical protein
VIKYELFYRIWDPDPLSHHGAIATIETEGERI